MNFLEIPDYYLYDFAESILGYSLNGGGRIVKFEENAEHTEKVLKIKRYFMNHCDNNEFIFLKDKCIRSKSYWSNQDLTSEFEDFYTEQCEFKR